MRFSPQSGTTNLDFDREDHPCQRARPQRKPQVPKKNGFQTPALPKAKPESLGFSSARLKTLSDVIGPRSRQGHAAGRRGDGRPQGQGRAFRRDRPARSGVGRKDAARLGVPDLLDDQADRLGRHHAAGRGGKAPHQRSAVEIHSVLRQQPGRRSARRHDPSRADEARDHHPGSAEPHQRHLLRDHRPGADPDALFRSEDLSPQHEQRGARGSHREAAVDLPAGRRVELQPLHRHSRHAWSKSSPARRSAAT